MDVDLQAFCAYKGERPRHKWLEAPFSFGDFSYATNGAIMVRVARREGIPGIAVQGEWDKPLADRERFEFVPFLLDLPPAPQIGSCVSCDGSGWIASAEDECEACHGRGWIDPELDISVELAGSIFCLSLVRRMAALPDIVISPASANFRAVCDCDPLQFSFRGGIGALCPLRTHYDRMMQLRWPKGEK